MTESVRPAVVVPVTVVIPAYNAARFIRSALDTVARQTVAPAEVIVVDDGSHDETARLAQSPAVRVMTVPHGGLAAARNHGINAATNDWVALLDADDLWHPRKLELQWELVARAGDLDLVSTDFDEVMHSGGVIVANGVTALRQYENVVASRDGSGVQCDPDVLAASLAQWDFLLPSTWLVRRTTAQRLLFDTGIAAEDWEFLLRLAATGGKVGIVELPLVAYVRHGDQLTAQWSQERASIQICEHVIAHRESYHPESVRAFRRWASAGRLRFAYRSFKRGERRVAVHTMLRWLRASASWAELPRLAGRLALQIRWIGPALASTSLGRNIIAGIPGRTVAAESRRNLSLPIPWRTEAQVP